MYNDFFLILCGPTGTGKTDLSYELAKKYPIEIINCDIGQFYKPLTIGTAKPAWKNQVMQHHLFDVIAEPKNFSVTEYRERVETLLQEIWARNALPVVVGGSMFYIKALFFPPLIGQNAKQDVNVTITSELTSKDTMTLTSKELWEKLFSIDPQRALCLHQNDTYRIKRALDLWHTSGGVLPSSCKPIFKPLAPFHITFIVREREELYARIDERVKVMIKEGWIEEVAFLSSSWQSFLKQKKILGYPEIISWLQENRASSHIIPEVAIQECKQSETLVQAIQKKTRNYAKRQITFWQSLKRDILFHETLHVISELNLTSSSLDLYLKNIQHIIKGKKEQHE